MKESNMGEYELLNSMEELQDAVKEVMKEGTIEQKLNLLLGDYIQRIERDKFQIRQHMQMQQIRNFNL